MWVSVEGIISVGKSTLLAELSKHTNIIECPEPVQKWIDSGMLELSYIDPKTYSFPAQCMFFDTRVDQINEVWQDGEIMVSERSPFSDKLFWETKRRNGDVNETLHSVYMNMWTKWQRLTPKECPDLFIYLNASLDTCMKRLKERGREAESTVTREYQETLKQVHDEVFKNEEVIMPNGKPVPVIIVDCELNYKENPEELQKLIQMILEKIHENKFTAISEYLKFIQKNQEEYKPREGHLLMVDEDDGELRDEDMKCLNLYY